MSLPEREQQIIQMHAPLVVMAAQVCLGAFPRQELDNVLAEVERMGQTHLVNAIRRLLDGEREASLLNGLDEDDQVILGELEQ